MTEFNLSGARDILNVMENKKPIYFAYGEEAIQTLSAKDPILADVMAKIGHVCREVDTDLFSSVVHQIIGQQISTKALTTIWNRMLTDFGVVDADAILKAGVNKIQSYGTTFRKAEYVMDFARQVKDGSFDIEAIEQLSDQEVIEKLVSLKGVGTWTAEMLLLFGMHRSDVLSYGDLAILRGMRMIYHRRKISKRFFEQCRKAYRPYGSVASLYLWEIAGGAIPELKDPAAPKAKPKKKK